MICITRTLLVTLATVFLAVVATAQTFREGATYMSNEFGGPVSFVDVDGDGDLDVVTFGLPVGNPTHEFGVWINDGDGNFVVETARRFPPRLSYATTFAKFGDIDLDGDVDIVFSALRLPLSSTPTDVINIWRNDGRGFFTDVTSTLAPTTQFSYIEDLVVADLDGDRFADIAVATALDLYVPGRICSVFINNRSGSFNDETSLRIPSTRASRVWAADCDSDGDIDLLFASKGPFTFLLNDGRGHFSPSPHSFGVSFTGVPSLHDFTGDGHIDAFVWNGHFDGFWVNNGNGSFRDESSRIPKPAGYTGTIGWIADFDGDGHPDIFGRVHGDSGPTYPAHYNLMMNDGQGRFRLIEAVIPVRPHFVSSGIMPADIDGDGDADLFDVIQPGFLETRTIIRKNLWRDIHSTVPPKLGQPYGIDIYTGQTPAVLLPFLSLGRSRLPLAGIGTFRLDLATTVALGAYPLDKPGGVQVPLPIPNDNALIGLPLSTQAAVIDTKALRVTGFTNARTEKIEK